MALRWPGRSLRPDRSDAYLSADGRFIVYHVGQPGARQVWIANADGSNPRNLSNNRYDEYSPVWLRSAATYSYRHSHSGAADADADATSPPGHGRRLRPSQRQPI